MTLIESYRLFQLLRPGYKSMAASDYALEATDQIPAGSTIKVEWTLKPMVLPRVIRRWSA